MPIFCASVTTGSNGLLEPPPLPLPSLLTALPGPCDSALILKVPSELCAASLRPTPSGRRPEAPAYAQVAAGPQGSPTKPPPKRQRVSREPSTPRTAPGPPLGGPMTAHISSEPPDEDDSMDSPRPHDLFEPSDITLSNLADDARES